jgi:hypothetical protein
MPTSSSAVSCCTHYLTASTASATTASSPMAPAITHPSSHSRVDEYVPILFIRIRYDRQQLLDSYTPLRSQDAEFSQMRLQSVDQLGALAHQ